MVKHFLFNKDFHKKICRFFSNDYERNILCGYKQINLIFLPPDKIENRIHAFM